MNRRYSYTLAAMMTAVIAVIGVVDPVADAAPGEVKAGKLHMIASVDFSTVVPTGGELAMGVPFVHAAKVSGDFSVSLDGAAVRVGQIVAGYLVGCAVDVSDGISIGIAPNVSVSTGILPSIGVDLGADLGLEVDAPPSVGLGVGVGLGLQTAYSAEVGLAGELAVNLAPGSVTAVVIGAAELDEEADFPYTFAHSNTPLTINGCLSPASAMPFVTVRADTKSSTAQTTGYGASFGF